MAKPRYYLVFKGRVVGLFDRWEGAGGAHESVRGFAGGEFRRVASLEEGERLYRERFGRAAPLRLAAPAPPGDEPDEDGVYVTYALLEPLSRVPFYVGQTRRPEERRRRHAERWEAVRGREGRLTRGLDQRLRELIGPPEFFVLERVRGLRASLASETRWVAYCRARGYELANAWVEHRAAVGSDRGEDGD